MDGGTGSVPSQAVAEKLGHAISVLIWDDTEVVPPMEIGRKRPAHWPVTERFSTPIIIFLTVCTKNRRKVLANNSAHDLLVRNWQMKPTWLVSRYVVMPDHIHLFCAPNDFIVQPLFPWV